MQNHGFIRTAVVTLGALGLSLGLAGAHNNHQATTTVAAAASPTVKVAKSAVAMNVSNQKFVWSKRSTTRRPIASVSKLMTLYLVQKKLQSNRAGTTWNSKVKTSYSGLKSMGKSKVYGGFKFKHNSYTVRQLYLAALVESSNNAAIALGQWVAGGSTPSANKKFIGMMNTQAKAWGMKKGSFVSASGMENNALRPYGYQVKGNYANLLSARNVATMAYHLIEDYPDVVKDTSIKSKTVAGQKLYNFNNLLSGRKYYQASLKVDGLKTGYTVPAGYCFVGTGQKSGHSRVITVVLHDANEFSETRSLMNYVYSHDLA